MRSATGFAAAYVRIGLVSFWFNRWRATAIGFLLLLPAGLAAQAVVRDAGARVAGGWVLPAEDGLSAGPELSLAAFYSHYFCGKVYGYHLEGGVARLAVDAGQQQVSQIRPFVGVYGKLRPHRYNRPQELSLLVGPRVDVVASQSPSTPEAESVQVGLHASVWYRLPRGKGHSWFVQGGLTYYPSDLLAAGSGGGLVLQVGVGTTWFHD